MVNAALAILKIIAAHLTSSTGLDALGAAAVVAGLGLVYGFAWGLVALGAALLLMSMARDSDEAT